jgi:signal transduction histidine kinase
MRPRSFNPFRLNLLAQFTLVGAGLTVLIALFLALILARQIEERTLDQASLNATEDAEILIGPLLKPSDLVGELPAERYREIDRALQPLLNRHAVVRVKLWNRDDTVIYHSDLPDLVGQRYPHDDERDAALQGRVTSGISKLDKEEHVFERGIHEELLEVHAPIRLAGSDEVLGVYELYSDVVPLRQQIAYAQRTAGAVVAIGFVILFLGLYSLVSRASRLLEAQATENARLAVAASRAEVLEELNELKSEFVSTVAHELRTPLTYLQGYSELLLSRQDTPPERQRRWLEIMNDETKRLSDLITELLDLSRIEQGRIEVHPRPLDLRSLVEERVALFRVQSEAHRLHAEAEEPLPIAWGDPQMLVRVIDNLLSNAIKYSPEGGNVTVHVQPDDDAVRVSVADEGIGIPEDQLTRIFDRFHRVDSQATRGVSGFGLGLSIVKASVELSGGRIWVDSAPGKGSVFNFTVPVIPAEKKTPVATA